MTLVRSTWMMNAGRSAAYGAGDFSSCAYFQDNSASSMIFSLGTMTVVPFFRILTLVVLCGVLARIFPAAVFLFLAGVPFYNLSKR